LLKLIVILSRRCNGHDLLLKHIFGDVFDLTLEVEGLLELDIFGVHHLILIVLKVVLLRALLIVWLAA
jgi:hypothetical protein